MADVCHVYGVAELLRATWREVDRDEEPDIRITDLGPMWSVEAPDVDADETVAQGVAEALTTPVFAPEDRPEEGEPPPEWFISRGWNYLNITNRTGKDKKADALRDVLAAIVPSILEAARAGPLIVADTYRSGGKETIPQGLETAAAKGSRSASRSSYAEGGMQASAQYWALSSVGAMAVGTFLYARQGQGDTAVVPLPANVSYGNNLEIRDVLRTRGLPCSASTTAALAHYAVRLSHAAITRMGGGAGPVAYSGIVYESMSRTGQQPKPAHGGLFPMEYLNAIAADDPAQALALCEVWDKVLVQGSFQGREMLALTLAEFLMHPSLSRLERHWRVHLRFSLRDKSDSKRVGVSYDQTAMKGLMEHVRA